MSWHYYFPLFLYGTEKYVWWQRDLAHNVFGPTVFGGADKVLKKIGGGQFLTEFGICLPDSSRPDYWGMASPGATVTPATSGCFGTQREALSSPQWTS